MKMMALLVGSSLIHLVPTPHADCDGQANPPPVVEMAITNDEIHWDGERVSYTTFSEYIHMEQARKARGEQTSLFIIRRDAESADLTSRVVSDIRSAGLTFGGKCMPRSRA